MTYFDRLLDHDYELVKSPAGANQYQPVGNPDETLAPAAHTPGQARADDDVLGRHSAEGGPVIPRGHRQIPRRSGIFGDAWARAWFKLCHRDIGPKVRYLGSEVPAEDLIWQDPIPAADHAQVETNDIVDLKRMIADAGLSVAELVATAWASASTYRGSDHRGGA